MKQQIRTESPSKKMMSYPNAFVGYLAKLIERFPIKTFGNDNLGQCSNLVKVAYDRAKRTLTRRSNLYNHSNRFNHSNLLISRFSNLIISTSQNLKFFYLIISISFVIATMGLSCKDEIAKPKFEPTINLLFEDASCTEVWLKLVVTDISNPKVTIKRDDSLIATYTLTTPDTTIIDENLLPSRTYTYTAQLLNYSNTLYSTTQCRTMDTTSHDWHFETYTLGDGSGSSCLYDVAIISDTLAYAVGEIYRNDTTFNVAKWNGQEWELMRIQFLDFCNQTTTFSYPAKAVWIFSENNVWITSGSQVVRWNGQTQSWPECIPVSVLKLWGENPNSIYAVGYNGGIAHYNGSSWRKIESGTILTLTDIYGLDNSIASAGSNISSAKGVILLKKNTSWETMAEGDLITTNELFKPKLYGSFTSVWIDDKNTIYTGGNLLFKYQFGKWDYVKSLPENYIGGNPNLYYRGALYKIRGNRNNDLWIIGDRNTLQHFNGVTWLQIGLPYNPSSDIIWRSLDVKKDFVLSVGDSGYQAKIIIIKK